MGDDAVWEYCWKELTVVVIGVEILHAKNSAVNYFVNQDSLIEKIYI